MAPLNRNLIVGIPTWSNQFKPPKVTQRTTNHNSTTSLYDVDAIVVKEEEQHHHQQVRFGSNSTQTIYNACQDEDGNEGDAASSLWYTREEEVLFKQSARRDIQRILQTEKDHNVDEVLCPVGLEQSLISREHSRKRIMMRSLVQSAVFWEQQWAGADVRATVCRRDEAIAEASTRASEWSRAQAQAIGYFQALAANKYNDAD